MQRHLNGDDMAEEGDADVIRGFASDISARLDEAAIIARTAKSLGIDGLPERAFQSLLDIEPLRHEACVLLNASAIVRRRDRSRGEMF